MSKGEFTAVSNANGGLENLINHDAKDKDALDLLTGIGVIILYAISGNTHDYHMTRMVVAILISFGCYLPVTLLSKKKPMIGMLMIPKTYAYIWVIVMRLQLL